MKNKKRETKTKAKAKAKAKAKEKLSNKKNPKGNLKDEYGYDFVAELSHFTNIDEQRENAERLEKL